MVRPGLDILFCGINPGMYSAGTGWHYARPGNRFWRALHLAGFTDRQLHPSEQRELLPLGYGLTNLVARPSASASELSAEEMRRGRVALCRKLRRLKPATVAFLGVGAYRTAFERPRAAIGRQPHRLGDSWVWVLPNPSGLNANYSIGELAEHLRAMRAASRAR